MRFPLTAVTVPLFLVAGWLAAAPRSSKPFGGEEDLAYARDVWEAIEGYRGWEVKTGVYPGTGYHGAFLRLWSTWVEVGGEHRPVVVTANYDGEEVSHEGILDDPNGWLRAITVMVQREPGYDAESQDWFYVEYDDDGEVAEAGGTKLAGAVTSCTKCHASAGGGDYLFHNDE